MPGGKFGNLGGYLLTWRVFEVSAGSACSAGRIEPPYVLRAMGVADQDALCALRVSLGWDTTEAEIDRFVMNGVE